MGICGIRYNRIGGGEAGDAGNVVPRVVVDEAEVVVVFLSGVAAVGVCLGGGGAVGAEGEVAGAAAADHAPAIVIAHDAVAAQVVAVQVQQVVGLARDDLPHGDGLPGEEVDAALDDGVAALDAAAVAVGRLRALRHGGGSFLVGKRPGVGPGAGLGRSLRPDRHGRARSSCRGGVATNRCRSSDSDNEVDGRFARTDYLHLVPNRGENVAAGGQRTLPYLCLM